MYDTSYSDLVLVTNDSVEFPCHKIILKKNSEYFDSLIKHDSNELDNLVKINISSKILDIILTFIYIKKYTFNLDDLPNLLDKIEEFQLFEFKKVIDAMIPKEINLLDTQLLSLFELYGLPNTLKCFRCAIIENMFYLLDSNDNELSYRLCSNNDISLNMKKYFQKSLLGCLYQDNECTSYHILMYTISGKDNICNINLCTNELSYDDNDFGGKIINTFFIVNKMYYLQCQAYGIFLISGNDSVRLDIEEIHATDKFIKSNDKLYVILLDKILIYSIDKFCFIECINIYNKMLPDNNYTSHDHSYNKMINKITVVDDKIYTISFCNKTKKILIGILENQNTRIINEYNIIDISNFNQSRSKHRVQYYINSICELNNKIYISFLFKVKVHNIIINNDRYYSYNSNGPQYINILYITRCIICNNDKSECKCKIVREWDNFHIDRRDYLCWCDDKECQCNIDDTDSQYNNEYKGQWWYKDSRDCHCYSFYYETIILEYNIETNIICPIAQIQEKNLYVTAFEDKLYAINIVYPFMLGVFDENKWIEIPLNINSEHWYPAFEEDSNITDFTLMRGPSWTSDIR